MSDLSWLTEARMGNLGPVSPNSHGRARLDDFQVLSGSVGTARNGLWWCDGAGMNAIGSRECPSREHGSAETLANCWKCWSDNGAFARIMVGVAAEGTGPTAILIDTTHR